MNFIPPNDVPKCPLPPKPLLHKQNRLERFIDKIDTNNDGKLSRTEMSKAADTNDDGLVSKSEKTKMGDKLNNYIAEAAMDRSLTTNALGKAQEVMEFLDDTPFLNETQPHPFPPTPFHSHPHHPHIKEGTDIQPVPLPRNKDGDEIPWQEAITPSAPLHEKPPKLTGTAAAVRALEQNLKANGLR